MKGADVAAVANAINAFPSARRDDLWSGVGFACAYAGGCGRLRSNRCEWPRGGHLPALAQGVAFAAKTRQRAANLNPHTETVCRLICGHSAEELAAITDAALEDLREEGALPAYEEWRRRIQNKIHWEVTTNMSDLNERSFGSAAFRRDGCKVNGNPSRIRQSTLSRARQSPRSPS